MYLETREKAVIIKFNFLFRRKASTSNLNWLKNINFHNFRVAFEYVTRNADFWSKSNLAKAFYSCFIPLIDANEKTNDIRSEIIFNTTIEVDIIQKKFLVVFPKKSFAETKFYNYLFVSVFLTSPITICIRLKPYT